LKVHICSKRLRKRFGKELRWDAEQFWVHSISLCHAERRGQSFTCWVK
jgi:hypothetical protein